jgi:hypothetical protein
MPTRNSMRWSGAGPLADHAGLQLDRAAAASTTLRNSIRLPSPVRDDAPVMRVDGGIDQIAAQAPEPR